MHKQFRGSGRCLLQVCLGALLVVLGVATLARAQRPVASATAPRTAGKLPTPSPTMRAPDRQRITGALARMPIRFEPLDERGTFLARGIGPAVRLTGTSIDFPIATGSRTADSIRVQFVGARQSRRVTGVDPLPGRVNYLLGDDPSRWRTNVRTYARAHTSSLYRGIDIEYYGAEDRLEYDLILRPGTRADVIRLAVSGASVAIDGNGDLVYGADQRVLLRKPVAYQMIRGARRAVSVEYRWRDDDTVGFAVGAYDRRQPLIIDPVVEYSFTLGGSGYDAAADIAVDDAGAVYIGGTTASVDFPTVNPVSGRQNAGVPGCRTGIEFNTATCTDGFLAKLRPDGAALEYATYFGVSSFDTIGHVAVDSSHAVYFSVEGRDGSHTDFDTTVFICKLATDGSRLIYKTSIYPYFIVDLTVGPDGSVYMNVFGTSVATLSPTGDNFHSIYTPPETGGYSPLFTAITTDGQNLFLAGYTSHEFPTTPGAAQPQLAGNVDGLILRMTLGGTLTYATFLGGRGNEVIKGLTVDSEGAIYVLASTTSPDFPRVDSAMWDPSLPERHVVAKLTAAGDSIEYATLLPYPTDRDSSLAEADIALNGTNVEAASCAGFTESGFVRRACQASTIGPHGLLLSTSAVPSALFAVDQTGARYFVEPTGDVTITKYFGVRLTSVVANASFPVRFGTPITWTAAAIADGQAEYSFWRYSTARGWTEVQAFGPSATYTWTPASWDVGDHFLCVFARPVGSTVPPDSITVGFTITGLAPGEPAVLPPAADFDGDRRPDLIWFNDTTGKLAAWHMGGGAHGEQLVAGGFLDASPLPAGWRVAGAGDVDGDGHTDLFLQSDTGLIGAWLFEGSVLRFGAILTPNRVSDLAWQIRAVGDFNHDGHPDLVWQHAPTGRVAFWLLNGLNAIGYVTAAVAPPGAEWEIVGSGDSNRDGERDLFWQHRSLGTLAVWRMHGTVVLEGTVLSASPSDAQWHVVAVSDLDGDAFSDLVLQHAGSGEVAAWYLSGDVVRFGAMLNPASAGMPAWKLVGPR